MTSIIGQSAAIEEFWNTCRSGKIPQSWIFTGPKGIGKSTFALYAARELLAGTISAKAIEIAETKPTMLFAEPEAPKAPTPDSIHDPDHPLYRKVMAGTHPDLLVIDGKPKDGEKQKSELGVDFIREVPAFLRKAAAEGSWRIVIIDDAEMMNRNASNAILKILEEPPAKSLIILVASTLGYFPPTIRSRCRVLRFAPLSDSALREYMQNYFPAIHRESDQNAYIDLSSGSIGHLKLLIESDAMAICGEVKRMLEHIAAKSPEWPRMHDLAEKFGANPVVAQIIMNKICESAIRPHQPDSPQESDLRPVLLQIKPQQAWLEYYDHMQELVGKQQFLYLDAKQTWLNLMAKMAA